MEARSNPRRQCLKNLAEAKLKDLKSMEEDGYVMPFFGKRAAICSWLEVPGVMVLLIR